MSKRNITIEDLYRVRLASDPNIAPDGSAVVFVNKRIDAEKNKYFSNLFMIREGRTFAFTNGDWSDSSPRWSPDSSQIAFVSNRNKPGSQVYIIKADGGEAQPVTKMAEGAISEIAWSPDGSKLAFTYRSVAAEWNEEAKEERKKKGLSNPPMKVTKTFYRLDGDGYFIDQRFHLYVIDLASGETKQLTDGDLYEEGDLAWSPDGSKIAFISNRKPDPYADPGFDDIWTVSPNGGEPTKIDSPDGPKGGLAWSPNGEALAYAGHEYPDDSWGIRNVRLWTLNLRTGEAKSHTDSIDNSLGVNSLTDMREFGGGSKVVWSADSASVYFLLSEMGSVRIYRSDLQGGHVCLTPGDHDVSGFSVASNGSVAFAVGTSVSPHEIAVAKPAGNSLDTIYQTDLNGAFLSEVNVARPEAFHVVADDGVAVHGWIMRPPDFDPNRKYPTILMIHGGPSAMYGNCFFHEFQSTAAQGFVVVYTNPRGGKGYGEAFVSAIKGDWGNRDYNDLMQVTDWVSNLPYVDADRMGVAGGSYGGYMTTWIVGHTDRFKTAVADRVVTNLVSMAGGSDFPQIPDRYWPGNAWSETETLRKCSPLTYAANVKTPHLLVHSEGDLRCPIGQADEWYSAMKRLGVEIVYVRYPVESSHGLSRSGPPDLRIHRLTQYIDWWNNRLKP
ncbi:MAG: S9 family peptidase [Armatimonadetes bacterium]|nr:S9 family peptidase [Armatimonadota bacterium]